ncbi:MAG: asparagine synthase (glutamine-hydrolyzing) [Nitrospina sp.]|jgi:asparagine synthase (glutamine-hydrolysing)|nr:asparagine synthase (glutamine-hydrolyzing) [Nitrospina sp.]
MCGISGVLSWSQPPDREVLKLMNDSLAHRGPDAEGIYIDGPLGLAHRRLSVIDLTIAANQPLVDITGKYCVVFNGEIYNFKALRHELETTGARFKTQSDTEVLLEAYKKWGHKCLDRFNGMFAFALWDGPQQQLFLARDRLGKKPLFYYMLPQGGLVFASELKALLEDPRIPRKMNMQALNQYLSFGYIMAPESMVDGVKKLEPAHYLIVKKGKETPPKQYWDLKSYFSQKNNFTSSADASDELLHLLRDAIKLRMVSDVSLGAFLSGGIDSSSIVAGMCHTQPSGSHHTFSMGFQEETFSELEMAKRVAQHLNVIHKDKVLLPNLAENLSEIAYYADEPFSDTSIIPMYYLAQFSRKHVTVCLSGDGADEIFGGYETYLADKICRHTGFLSPTHKNFILRLINQFSPTTFNKVSLDYKLRKFFEAHSQDLDRAHASWRVIFSESEKQSLVCPELFSEYFQEDTRNRVLHYGREVQGCHYLDRAMYMDTKTWLPDDILVKVDRASMAHGMETRSPFLDYRLVEFAASLPVSLKIHGFQKKYLLKLSQKDSLPWRVRHQRKKGFNSPVSHWMLNTLKPFYEDILSTQDDLFGEVILKNTIKELYNNHQKKLQDNGLKLFSLIMLSLWKKRFKVSMP